MTENYISNNIELNWTDRPVKKGSVDHTNNIYKKIISIIKDTRNGKTEITVVSYFIIQSDYPNIEPEKMLCETKVTKLGSIGDVSDAISTLVKTVFKDYPESDRVVIEYVSPSSNQKHEQAFYREDKLGLLQSCFLSDDTSNPMPLEAMLRDYGKMIISLFTADNIKSVVSQFQSFVPMITSIFGRK
jgi:hypothetical protein